MDTSASEQDDSVEDKEAYVQLWKRTREANDWRYKNSYTTFIDNGKESDYAQKMTEERLQHYNQKEF